MKARVNVFWTFAKNIIQKIEMSQASAFISICMLQAKCMSVFMGNMSHMA